MNKQLQDIFFLVNTSGYMMGQPIDAVNVAMREVIPEIQKIARENVDVAIRYNVLEFNNHVNWITSVGIEDFQWIDLCASSGTRLGEAYAQLVSKLSIKEGVFFEKHHNCVPIIILLLANSPIDDVQYGLNLLRRNRWFQVANKIAIEVEVWFYNTIVHENLLDFTESENNIIYTDEYTLKDTLREMMITIVKSIDFFDVSNLLDTVRYKVIPKTDSDI